MDNQEIQDLIDRLEYLKSASNDDSTRNNENDVINNMIFLLQEIEGLQKPIQRLRETGFLQIPIELVQEKDVPEF